MRQFLSRALEKAGHEVLTVSDGVDALPVLAEGQFDLLLADIVMPEMDGIELARRAMAVDPNIHVIFITGFAAVAMKQLDIAKQDTKVLSKPFHLRQLVEEIERELAAA